MRQTSYNTNKMINEIPFPTPLSVILSPSHKINILPAAKIIVEEIVNQMPPGNAPPAFLVVHLSSQDK
jgi:hypothetical protein